MAQLNMPEPAAKPLGVVNGPPKIESLANSIQVSSRISQNFLMVSSRRFVSVGHIYAFLLSQYTFLSRLGF